MTRIYLYNPKAKEELLGITKYYANDGEKYDVGYIATITNRLPLGLLLSNIISINFDLVKEFIQQEDIEALSNELCFPLEWFSSTELECILEDINAIYLLKSFIDFCGEFPNLYSIDYFYRFWNDVCSGVYDFPIDTEYYADPGDLLKDEISMGYNVRRPKEDAIIDLDSFDFERNVEILRNNLLGPDPYAVNPEKQINVVEIKEIVGFVCASLNTLINEKYIVKKCSNCGKYFVPLNRSDTIYCDRPSPNDPQMTCKEYGSQKLWYDRLKKDEVAKLARNIYSAKQMLVRRNPDMVGYKKMFEYFKSERKKWEALVKSGEKSKEEYISWLNEMKAKKTL